MTYLTNRRQLTIEWGHCNPDGIATVTSIFEFFDAGTWLLFEAALGVTPPNLGPAFEILGIPLVDVRAHYLIPPRFSDVVEVSSGISEFRRSSFEVHHRIWKDGQLAVEGHETRVWTVQDHRDPSRLRSKPIPAAVIDRFRSA